MESELRAILTGNAGVSALVGTRVHWIERAQGGGLPSITLTGISRGENYSLHGRDGLATRRVQVDCWAETYASAKAVEAAVIAALSGYSGGIFQGIFLLSARDMREASGSDDFARIFRASLDFSIIHEA